MTAPVQNLIESFDALTDAEKHQAVVAILRRVVGGEGDLRDDSLSAVADDLFQAMDVDEAQDAAG